jgi:hypothetical protein
MTMAVRGYAERSVEIARDVFHEIGFIGEASECSLELIKNHEYIFFQILQMPSTTSLKKLCVNWRNKLGSLWKQHLEFAASLWEGRVLNWIETNMAEIHKSFDLAEEKLFDVAPEESCPFDGDFMLQRYGLPQGAWIGIMKREVGRWCLINPHEAKSLEAVEAAADAIFASNRKESPAFLEVPALTWDDPQASSVPDPLGIRHLLKAASRLSVAELRDWSIGYQRKTVVATIRALATRTNGKTTASQCGEFLDQIATRLQDVQLGEILKALHHCGSGGPSEVVSVIRERRLAVGILQTRYEVSNTIEIGLQLARALRDLGHFEEALLVTRSICVQFPDDLAASRLDTSIRKHL